MIAVLKSTWYLILLFCLYAFTAGVLEGGVGYGLYFAALGAASLVVPVFLFVLIYHFLVRKRWQDKRLWLRLLGGSLSLLLLAFPGLLAWAILEFLITAGASFNWQYIWEDYRSEYLGYLPVVILLSLLIPVVHHLLRPKENRVSSGN